MGNNAGGAIGYGLSLGTGIYNLLNIMAINLQDLPIIGPVFIYKRLQRHYRLGWSINLNVIAVHYGGKVS